jgi:hypothetical protein
VATQVFADEELERLREFPEIGRDELARFFTLTPADVAFVDPGRGRGPVDQTYDRLAGEFTQARCAALDGLLVVDPEVKTTRLRWLSTGPVEASPAAVRAEVGHSWSSCGVWVRTRWTCRCCRRSGGGSWPRSGGG